MKLSFITFDSKILLLRSDNLRGIKMINLEDGTFLGEYKDIHKNSILQIIATKNNKYIITCGVDNKIKVFDWRSE